MLLEGKIPIGYILKKIKYDIPLIIVVGIITHLLAKKFNAQLPLMPPYIPTLLGTAISILLSFKMNQSYDRWWEARKIWGAIVNDSRTWVVQLQSFIAGKPDETIRRMAYRQIAFCYSLGQSLRSLDPLANITQFVEDDEMKAIGWHKNVPLALVHRNAEDLRILREAGVLDSFHHMQLDSTLVRLVDSMGKAERIKSTVFPATYRLFLHFLIYTFCVTLSIALNDIDTMFALPLLLVIASCFFLIEKSANHMQDPFSNRPSDTAMTTIARTIELNIRQLLGEAVQPETKPVETFYLM